MSQTPEQWFRDLPIITKAYFVLVVLSTVSAQFGVLRPDLFAWHAPTTFKHFHFWRPIATFLFVGKFSLSFVFTLYILVRYSTALEKNPFGPGGTMGRTGDYLFMLMFGASVMLLIGWAMDMYYLAHAMVFMILYVWSRRNADAPMSLFGFRLQGIYMPWAMMLLSLLMGNSIISDVIGVVTGHLYYFLIEIAPQAWNFNALKTPQFIHNWFDSIQFTTAQTARGEAVRMPRPMGHNWGQGRMLGAQ